MVLFDDSAPVPVDLDLQLSPVELEALGDISGLRVLHLATEGPAESLALARLGADVVAVGVPEPGAALDYVAENGIAVELIGHDLADLHDSDRDSQFDVVYAGPATLAWVENLNDWVVDAAEALVPGGRFVMFDEHPSSRLLEPLDTTPAGEEPDEDDTGLDPDLIPLDQGWALDELTAELRERGLAIRRLDELTGFQRFLTTAEMRGQAESGVSTAFILIAERPAGP